MKKIIGLLILIILCYGVHSMYTKKTEEKVNNDLEMIRQVDEACQAVAKSKQVFSLGNDAATLYIFDLELIYKKEGECYEALVYLLGEDFPTILSNGDRLFVGFLPFRQEYYIYADDPREEANMIYPDWNYDKLSPIQ